MTTNTKPKWWQVRARARRRALIREHDRARSTQLRTWLLSMAVSGQLLTFDEDEMAELRAKTIGAPDPRVTS